MFPGVDAAIRPDYTRYQNSVTKASQNHSYHQTFKDKITKNHKNKKTSKKITTNKDKLCSQAWLPPSDVIIRDIKTLSPKYLTDFLTTKPLKKKFSNKKYMLKNTKFCSFEQKKKRANFQTTQKEI